MNQDRTIVPKVLWAALVMAQLSFIYIQKTMAVSESPVPPDFETMRMILSAVAAGSVVISYVMPKFLLGAMKRNFEQKGQSLDSMDLGDLIPRVFPAMIIRWALLESCTVIGFLLSLFSKDPNYVMAFAAVSLVGFALTFPSERSIRQLISGA